MPASRDRPRSAAKRRRIVEAAMRRFAEHGYQGARVEVIANDLGIAKGSIFQHFGSKAGLFLAAYKDAIASLPAWLDAPDDVVADGFWSTFLLSEDPYGTLDFVEFGIRRGEVRSDIDVEMLASMVDWAAGAFQDALVTEELDPGLFHRRQEQPTRREQRIEQFIELVRGAIGRGATRARSPRSFGPGRRRRRAP
jgi:AcrR family transcriptional regulator